MSQAALTLSDIPKHDLFDGDPGATPADVSRAEIIGSTSAASPAFDRKQGYTAPEAQPAAQFVNGVWVDPTEGTAPDETASVPSLLNGQCAVLVSMVDMMIVGKPSEMLFGGMSYGELGASYEAALSAKKAAESFLSKVSVQIEDRIKAEGLNPSAAVTEKREAGFILSLTKEPAAPAKALDFDKMVLEMESEAKKSGYALEAEKCITRKLDVNRTTLKTLMKAGGKIAEIGARLFTKPDPLDFKLNLSVKRVPTVGEIGDALEAARE